MKILEEVLEEIKPKGKKKEVKEFLSKLNILLKGKAKAIVGGSYAKNVWLKGDHDVDIFAAFGKKYSEKNMSQVLENLIKPLKPKKLHGSRDYFQIKFKDINFEIVPVLNIKTSKEAKNITDCSILHVKWFLKEGKKLEDDIRLAKKFCKSQKVYGAESYIGGVSGHVLDILVVYTGGFINFLKFISKAKKGTVIDYYKVHKGNARIMINKSKQHGPLLVVDPVEPERNAAAALTEEKFKDLVNAAKKFLKNPDKKMFEEKPLNAKELLKKGYLCLEVKPLSGKRDVVGAKLLGAFKHIGKEMKKYDVKGLWAWKEGENALFCYKVKVDQLPLTHLREGPPIENKNAVQEFKKKHKKTIVKNGKIFAELETKERTPQETIERLTKEEYVKSRIRGMKWV